MNNTNNTNYNSKSNKSSMSANAREAMNQFKMETARDSIVKTHIKNLKQPMITYGTGEMERETNNFRTFIENREICKILTESSESILTEQIRKPKTKSRTTHPMRIKCNKTAAYPCPEQSEG